MSEEAPKDAPNNTDMPLISHLIELRGRLMKSVFAILIIFIGFAIFANELYLFVAKPLIMSLPVGSSLIATEVTSPLLTPFKLAFAFALFSSMPYLLHQAWKFISPALYKKEKRFAVPLLICSIFLFYAGMAFAYYVIFPIVFPFLADVGPVQVAYTPEINSVLNTALKLFFAFGMAFEIPIATLLLIWSGMSSVESLKEKRPYIIVGVFIVGMLLTPPDIISQTLLALPMWILFELGLFFARIFPMKQEEPDEQTES